jgi:uncharacterized membrane protein
MTTTPSPGRALAPWIVVAAAVAMLLLSFAQRLPCTQSYRAPSGQLELNWGNDRPFVYFCYSDVIGLYTGDHIAGGAFPYKTSWVETANTPQVHYVEYPVLTGLLMWVGGRIAAGYDDLAGSLALPRPPAVVVYFDVIAVVLAIAWLLVVGAVLRLTERGSPQALLVALSPLVLAQLYTNFDALAVAFATLALLAWARERPLLAGVMLGLGGAAKLYPLLLLIPLLVLCLRAGRLREGLRALGGAVLGWGVANAPIALLYPSGWSYFFRFSAMRGAGFESLYSIVAYFGGVGLDRHLAPGQVPAGLNTLSAGLFAAACLAICAIALGAPRRPRLAPLCLLVVVAFLLVNKSYSPQYSLWLVPLAVLALPRWRLLVPWMTIDALLWVPTLLFQRGSAHGGIGEGWFLGAVILRDVALGLVCAFVVYEIYRPARDVLRRDGADDACGGALDGAPDRVRLGRRGLTLAR